ncbi:hypothetical protein JY651_50595 [Pyxidicoccus parkwayensis]|uniref:RCK C-terminal domain-containing protein n=1 Tax=Pyxidicoccus parkwayensis TaxID=2813578 RepID=A0ABX7P0N7_9BACT|nr:TrkA C-terminal domain-containing protein [Pyxidicoccus parkwaysis]QSQ23239.1 hypothetical protein JY651_50595 [Pyxidicoccus parkwaysis]
MASTAPTSNQAHALRLAAWAGLILSGILLVRLLARDLPSAAKATGLLGPVFAFMANQPFVLLFATVAAGYALGRVTVLRFNLGATAATLIIGLGLSLWASLRGVTFTVPDFGSTLFFNLFMFAVGMKVGPQFLSGLRRDARAFIALGLLVPLLSAGLMLGLREVFHLAPGLAPGIFAGANTATPGLGAAKDVYLRQHAGDPTVLANLSTAFAFGYCVSLVLFVLMMKVLPRWFGRDVKKEAKAYQRELEAGAAHALPGTANALAPDAAWLAVRAFKLEYAEAVGQSLAQLRERFPEVALERVHRGEQTLELTDSLRLQRDDVVVVSGPLWAMVRVTQVIGPELPDVKLREVGLETVEVVAQTERSVGRRVGDLLHKEGHGFYINALFRGGVEIPHGPETVVRRGDVFRITGSQLRIHQLAEALGGRVVRPSMTTDIVTLALGLSVGAFLGTLPIPLFGLNLSLGSAVGLLLTGIVLSTLRTRNPRLGGPFPEPARQLLEDLGLNVFIAITALNAGAGVIQSVRAGVLVPIAVGTLVAGMIPPVIGWMVGQYRHHMNAGLLEGAIAGARCSSPGLRTAQEDTESTVPALSYPVTFAISNIVVTLGCYLLASLD